ncbi:pyruvate formate lyase family protein, partial [[Clostridium] scindens]|nr:pyruvate formate lyase family protein [[Clostridium] scindens]
MIDEAKHALTNTDLQDAQRNYYQAVIISLEGALLFFQRFAKLAEEMAEHEQDEKRRQELRVIAHMAGTMMEQGA